jgi:hypothetical protein
MVWFHMLKVHAESKFMSIFGYIFQTLSFSFSIYAKGNENNNHINS